MGKSLRLEFDCTCCFLTFCRPAPAVMKPAELHDIPGLQRIQRATDINTPRLAFLVICNLGVYMFFFDIYVCVSRHMYRATFRQIPWADIPGMITICHVMIVNVAIILADMLPDLIRPLSRRVGQAGISKMFSRDSGVVGQLENTVDVVIRTGQRHPPWAWNVYEHVVRPPRGHTQTQN